MARLFAMVVSTTGIRIPRQKFANPFRGTKKSTKISHGAFSGSYRNRDVFGEGATGPPTPEKFWTALPSQNLGLEKYFPINARTNQRFSALTVQRSILLLRLAFIIHNSFFTLSSLSAIFRALRSVMAKLTQQQLEAHLWGAANILRAKASAESSLYHESAYKVGKLLVQK